jgi:hypothetical protein
MKGLHKHTVSRILLGVTVLMLVTMDVSALVYLNGSDQSYNHAGTASAVGVTGVMTTCSPGKTIKHYVIEGAEYFLSSYSDFLVFLRKIEVAELKGLDYNEVQMDLINAIEKMEYAKDVLTCLKAEADVTPYNPDVLAALLNFDYDLFMVENGLLQPIFDQVKCYLSNGEPREVYGKAISDMDQILKIADAIKSKIDAGVFPDVSSLWDLGQSCSDSLLFGQYVARVYFKINVK